MSDLAATRPYRKGWFGAVKHLQRSRTINGFRGKPTDASGRFVDKPSLARLCQGSPLFQQATHRHLFWLLQRAWTHVFGTSTVPANCEWVLLGSRGLRRRKI